MQIPNAQQILDGMQPPQRYTDARQVPQPPEQDQAQQTTDAQQVPQPQQRRAPPQGGSGTAQPRAPGFQRASDRRDTEIFGPDWDGAKDRYWDPLVVHRRLAAALEGNPTQWLQDCQSQDPMLKNKGLEKVVPAIVYAFDLVPFDPATGLGTSERQAKELMNRFHAWLEKKNPTPATSPTPSEPPASGHPTSTSDSQTQPTTPTPPADSAGTSMGSGLGSGSTRSGCGCNERPPLLNQPGSPIPSRLHASGSMPSPPTPNR